MSGSNSKNSKFSVQKKGSGTNAMTDDPTQTSEDVDANSDTAEIKTADTAGVVDPSASETNVPEPEAPPAVVVTPVVEPVVIAAVDEPVKPSRDSQSVTAILSEYKNLMGLPIVTDEAIDRGVKLFSRASEIVCESADDDARDAMWDFYVAEKNGLMRENLALRGAGLITGSKASMLLTVYAMYRHKTTNSGMAFSDERVKEMTSLALLLYFQFKAPS